MSVTINKPYVLQGASHSALLFRQAISTLVGPDGGAVRPNDLAVSQNGTPNMSVNVAAGEVWVPGSFGQALYYTRSDAIVNLAINPADGTNPRVDTVVVQIEDAAYAGSANDAVLRVVAGTPTSGATLGNLNGAGPVPDNSQILAYVLVPNGATTIITTDILQWISPFSTRVGPGSTSPGRMHLAGAQTIPNTGAIINFDTVDFDPGGAIDLSTHRYTVQRTGYHQVIGQIGLPAAAQTGTLAVVKNGTTFVAYSASPVTDGASVLAFTVTVTDHILLGAGDYIQLLGYTGVTAAAGPAFFGVPPTFLSVIQIA